MTIGDRSVIAVIAVCAATLSGCCAKSTATQIRVLSEQEAADLWAQAERYEPIGQADVRRIDGETSTTVVTTQAYMLQNRGGGTTGIVVACGFACVAPPGKKPSDCVTSGCKISGKSCTPASCGGCTMSQPCQPTTAWGIFGGGLIMASGANDTFMARLDPPTAPPHTDAGGSQAER